MRRPPFDTSQWSRRVWALATRSGSVQPVLPRVECQSHKPWDGTFALQYTACQRRSRVVTAILGVPSSSEPGSFSLDPPDSTKLPASRAATVKMPGWLSPSAS